MHTLGEFVPRNYEYIKSGWLLFSDFWIIYIILFGLIFLISYALGIIWLMTRSCD